MLVGTRSPCISRDSPRAELRRKIRMKLHTVDTPSAWSAEQLRQDSTWEFDLSEAARARLVEVVKAAYRPAQPLFAYQRQDFDLDAAWPTLSSALREAYHGRGLALVHGLPADELDEHEFELLSWAIGLHIGVARPQGKASHYLSAVRDAGTDYRAATGRGYSSNSGLDFHVDGADLTTLACFNAAKSGGQSMITSSVNAWNTLLAERPDLAEILCSDFYFSRQAEQAPDETPYYGQPIVDFAGGRLFMKWNRNRVMSAQKLDGVPQLSARQHEAINALDAILRRPELMYTMYLVPGDLQLLNNFDMLHSRTNFIDFDEPARKRLLHRLWLVPPDAIPMPDSWTHFFRCVHPGSVRGGIRGHHFDAECRAFDRRQALEHGMHVHEGY